MGIGRAQEPAGIAQDLRDGGLDLGGLIHHASHLLPPTDQPVQLSLHLPDRLHDRLWSQIGSRQGEVRPLPLQLGDPAVQVLGWLERKGGRLGLEPAPGLLSQKVRVHGQAQDV
jgi:hypothetical protein